MATETKAAVRVDVTGNAPKALDDIAKAAAKTSTSNTRAARSATEAGKALDKEAASAKKLADAENAAAAAATKFAGANARGSAVAAGAAKNLSKQGAATIAAAAKLKQFGNDAKAAESANKRVSTSAVDAAAKMTALARSVDKVNATTRQLTGTNSRIAPPPAALSMWQRLARTIREAASKGAELARTGGRGAVGQGIYSAMGGAMHLGGMMMDAGRSAASTIGVSSREQLAGQYIDNNVRLARLSAQAHWTDSETADYRAQINSAARSSMMSPSEIISIVETGQNRFSDARGFMQAAPEIARFANATGTDTGALTGVVGESFRQMGVRPDQIRELLGSLQATSEAGSVEASDIADSMSPSIGAYRALTGSSGLAGMQQFLGLAQVMGSSGGDAATLTQNLIAKLSSADVQRNLSRRGINAMENGHLNIQSMIEQITTSSRFRNADGTLNQRAMQGVLGADMQANQAMLALYNAEQSGNGIQSIANASAAAGNATVDTALARMQEGASGDALRARSDATVNFQENGERYVQALASAAAAASAIDTRFPLAAAAADGVRGAFDNLTSTLATLNLAGLGGVAGAAAGAGGAGTAAAGGAAAAAGKAGSAIPLALAAYAGWNGGVAISDMISDSVTGGNAAVERANVLGSEGGVFGSLWHSVSRNWGSEGDRLEEQNSPEAIRRRVEAFAQQSGGTSPAATVADPANTEATAANTAAVERLAAATERNTAARNRDDGDTGNTAGAGR